MWTHPGMILLDAAERGDAAQVAALLAGGALDSCADPAAEVNLALRRAAEMGHAEVARLLLIDPRADLAALGDEAFRLAAGGGMVLLVTIPPPFALDVDGVGFLSFRD